jgi:hypothetical protein
VLLAGAGAVEGVVAPTVGGRAVGDELVARAGRVNGRSNVDGREFDAGAAPDVQPASARIASGTAARGAERTDTPSHVALPRRRRTAAIRVLHVPTADSEGFQWRSVAGNSVGAVVSPTCNS